MGPEHFANKLEGVSISNTADVQIPQNFEK